MISNLIVGFLSFMAPLQFCSWQSVVRLTRSALAFGRLRFYDDNLTIGLMTPYENVVIFAQKGLHDTVFESRHHVIRQYNQPNKLRFNTSFG